MILKVLSFWYFFVYKKSFYGEDKNQAKLNFRFSCKTKEQRDKWINLIKANAPNCPK